MMRASIFQLIKRAEVYGWINYPTLFRAKPGQADMFTFLLNLANNIYGTKIRFEYDPEGTQLALEMAEELKHIQ